MSSCSTDSTTFTVCRSTRPFSLPLRFCWKDDTIALVLFALLFILKGDDTSYFLPHSHLRSMQENRLLRQTSDSCNWQDWTSSCSVTSSTKNLAFAERLHKFVFLWIVNYSTNRRLFGTDQSMEAKKASVGRNYAKIPESDRKRAPGGGRKSSKTVAAEKIIIADQQAKVDKQKLVLAKFLTAPKKTAEDENSSSSSIRAAESRSPRCTML